MKLPNAEMSISKPMVCTFFFLLLSLGLMPMELKAAKFDYYGTNTETRRGIHTVEKHHWKQALTAIKGMRFKTAKGELDFILRWIPNHPHALIELSKLSITMGHPEIAIPYLDSAIKFNPQYENSHAIYGIHLFKVNRLRDSIEKFKTALAINPDSSEVHYNLGLAFIASKNYSQAKVHAEKAYSLDYPLAGLRDKLKAIGHWDISLTQEK